MVEMVMREEEITDLCRPQPSLDELIRRGRAAVKNQVFLINWKSLNEVPQTPELFR